MDGDIPIQTNSVYSDSAGQAQSLSRPQTNSQIQQKPSGNTMEEWAEEVVFNPLAMLRRFNDLKKIIRGKDDKEGTEKTKKEEKIQQIERVESIADEYSRKSNQELQARTLVYIRERITNRDTPEEVIRKVMETYPDYSLADEVFDFLIETSPPAIAQIVRQAKEQLNRDFGREISAGKNIGNQARKFSMEKLGSPTALRKIYADITGNQRDANTLFEQLSNAFPYDKMKTLIDFLLHSLGADLKSKGPSIARGELHRLMTETRVLQAILGVYRFFRSRMKPILDSFNRRGLVCSSKITFEALSKVFMKYIQERYPSPDKVLQLGIPLDIAEEIVSQLIILTQFRDATRQIAPKLFRDEKHRLETLRSFMEALKQLEEEEEEKEEKQEEKKIKPVHKKRKKEEPRKMA